MLVLSRKPGQEIVIDERISVRILSVKGKVVRLGIMGTGKVRRGELAPREEVDKGKDGTDN